MRRSRGRGPHACVAAAVHGLLGAVAFAACGGTSTSPSSSPNATPVPAASPAASPARGPRSRWDAPGSATLAQTLAVTRRYAAAPYAETIPAAGLSTSASAFDSWSGAQHLHGAEAILSAYRDAGPCLDWSRRYRVTAAPGVGVYDGMLAVSLRLPAATTPSLSLLAADGDRITHEDVFPDKASVAAKIGAAVGDAFAGGDVALRAVVAPDVLFRDTSQPHGARGWNGVLEWWSRVPAVDLENEKPVAGPGRAVVVRWSIRTVSAAAAPAVMPRATVMEVRGGKVVRMTLEYESQVIRLQL